LSISDTPIYVVLVERDPLKLSRQRNMSFIRERIQPLSNNPINSTFGAPPASVSPLSRRDFLRHCAATATVASVPLLGGWSSDSSSKSRGPAARTFPLNQGWLFGGKFDPAGNDPSFDDSGFTPITLPHCVTPLSWQKWDPASWQDIWLYRRHFSLPPELSGQRVFVEFDRVMAAATPSINGHALAEHLGGYLPFEREITGLLRDKNVLSLKVDSRWLPIPPAGSPSGPISVDYLLPGGINGSARLRVLPQVFLSNVFARPIDVLSSSRRLEVSCTLDAGTTLSGPCRLTATLLSGSTTVATASRELSVDQLGENETMMTITGLHGIQLWDVASPHLYDLVVTLSHGGQSLHHYRTRVGFREARFELDGFFLNGKRLQLFGLNRHEIYPYAGYAMSPRTFRRDAEILRHEFNCNVVRCSHYPQSPAFLDACDELGLMVWEETPGWQYIGDERWQDLVVEDVREMVRRDRNRPSVIIWGVRVNESHNDPELYLRTRDAAKKLDGSRPTSGSMTFSSMKNWQQEWHQDVFALDDYHSAPDGSVALKDPVPGVPFFFAEAVGQFNYTKGRTFDSIYRRAGDLATQEKQAIYHAQVHDRGASNPRYGGVIAWCAFEYASLHNGYDAVKCPGIADVFRIPKLGASFYRSQVDPAVKPVIEPNFYWNFDSHSPQGPGKKAAIFSNCDRLELKINGRLHSTLRPDRISFPRLKYPPFFADLDMDGSEKPELRIDGYVGNHLVLSRSFSADSAADRLSVSIDDSQILGDGSDATRLIFQVTDKHGALRPFVQGAVSFKINGPAAVLGDNPFQLEDSGGSGAVWIRGLPRSSGKVRVTVLHPSFGEHTVAITVLPDPHVHDWI